VVPNVGDGGNASRSRTCAHLDPRPRNQTFGSYGSPRLQPCRRRAKTAPAADADKVIRSWTLDPETDASTMMEQGEMLSAQRAFEASSASYHSQMLDEVTTGWGKA
jgi:hypothetical protein